MKILIAAIGKPRTSPEQMLVEEYQKRLGGHGGWEVQIQTFESTKATAPQRQAQESSWLLETTQAFAMRIVLDERGKNFASEAFARKIGDWQNEGQSRIAFLIGGADGHTDAVRKQANLLLSLSAMTLPHLLARAVLMEQLYRASTILAGHPYHRA